MAGKNQYREEKGLKFKLHEIIFEADTPAGKTFDILLLIVIFISVLVVILESIESLRLNYGRIFFILEWIFTILFTIEYILRVWIIKKPFKYIFSFYGIIDLLATIPTYLSLFIYGSQYLLVIRALRLLRVFRIFKLGRFLRESNILIDALKASRVKISVFLFAVVTLTVIIGSLMYLIEGPENGFTNIPIGIYWAIVTLTTVGYGDITPSTNLGKLLSSIVMILGYGIIAIPTGIVTAELARTDPVSLNTQSCPNCSKEGHDDDAEFCKFCGEEL